MTKVQPKAKSQKLKAIINHMAIYHKHNYSKIFQAFYWFSTRLVLTPIYYTLFKIKVSGKENIDPNKTYVIMPNHLSNLDPPLVAITTGRPIAYMAKIELFKIPVLSQLIQLLGAFSVNRGKVEKTTIKAAKEIIKKKWDVGVFLEGTRSKTPGVLGTPNAGPAFIANLNKVEILPIGLLNTNNPKKGIQVIIGKSFTPVKDIEEAKQQCLEELSKLTGLKIN